MTITATIMIASTTTGCVMAVRRVAREANRSGVESKARERFAIGSSVGGARTALAADGYACRDMPALGKTAAHVSCWPSHRTGAVEKFLVGGNWRWDLYSDGDALTKVHIVSAKHGLRQYRKAAQTASADPK